jgi:hypothetical protein
MESLLLSLCGGRGGLSHGGGGVLLLLSCESGDMLLLD